MTITEFFSYLSSFDQSHDLAVELADAYDGRPPYLRAVRTAPARSNQR